MSSNNNNEVSGPTDVGNTSTTSSGDQMMQQPTTNSSLIDAGNTTATTATTTTTTTSDGDQMMRQPITDSSLEAEAKEELGAATASLDMSKVIMRSNTQTSAEAKRAKRNYKIVWTPKEDEALMIAVLEERKTRDEKEDEMDDDEEDDFDEEDEEDWEVIDWDLIAETVPGRSSVECLKRYLKHKKTHEVAKAVSTTSVTPAIAETSTAGMYEKVTATMPAPKPPKRKGASTVIESEEMILSAKKKKKDEIKWTDEEIGLLSSLAEQYHDSKCTIR